MCIDNGSEPAVPALVALADDTNALVRAAAAAELARLGTAPSHSTK